MMHCVNWIDPHCAFPFWRGLYIDGKRMSSIADAHSRWLLNKADTVRVRRFLLCRLRLGYVIVHYKPYTELLWLLSPHRPTHLRLDRFFLGIRPPKHHSFYWRSKRTGFCSSQLDDLIISLCDAADTQLFTWDFTQFQSCPTSAT